MDATFRDPDARPLLPSRRLFPRRALWWQFPVVFTLAVLSVSAAGPSAAFVPLMYLAVVTPELWRVDSREHRLPNLIVLPGVAVGGFSMVIGAVGGVPPWPAIGAAVGYSGVLLIFCLAGAMGMGDVKLAAALGLASWVPLVGILSPVIAFLSGGVAAVCVMARRGRGGRMPFGPYLLLGFWVAVALTVVARYSA